MIYNSFEPTGMTRVLKFLQAHDAEYISGQDLSDVLRISRVAVWKHIKKIKDLGYVIDSKQRLGYRLVAGSDLLLPWEIVSGLGTKMIGQRAFYLDCVDSTQDQALRMAVEPQNNGAIIVAQRQTAGRGRSGKRWISPEGGIWLSVILQPEFDVSVATMFPIAASLALSYAIEETLDVKPELKWPNDLTIHGKKIAGILTDASLESNKIEYLVMGVGINFDVNTAQIERELNDMPDFYGAASLEGKSTGIRPVLLVQRFLEELEKACDLLYGNSTGEIISEWTKRSSTIGRRVEVRTVGGTVKGIAKKLDGDGALIVSDGGNTRIVAGEITHL